MKPTPRPNPPAWGERVGHIPTLLSQHKPPFHWIATLAGIMGITAFYLFPWLWPLY
jgi:hypothetical protein